MGIGAVGRACAFGLLALVAAHAPAGGAAFEALAEGAYLLPGPALAAAAPPAGEAGNVGLLAGRDASLIVDTGASHRQGQAVLAAVRAAGAPSPKLALISHVMPEFLFGASALQAAGIPVLAERDAAQLIAQRCATCLERYTAAYGEAAMAGSRVPVPERQIDGGMRVDLGGREVRILDFGWAVTPGALAVLDPDNGILFAGGLVQVERVPVLRDARLAGWVAALERIAALPLRRIVPGHGPARGPEAVLAMRDYLLRLDAEVRRLYAARATLSETVERAVLPDYAGWEGYPLVHRQNVHALYLAVEREELGAEP